MRRFLSRVRCAALALSLAGVPAGLLAQTAVGDATLTLLRQSRFTAGAVHTGFWVDGQFVGAMKNGSMTLSLRPGAHRIEASNALPCDAMFAPGDCETNPFPHPKVTHDLELAPGATALLEVFMATDPWISFRPHAQPPRWLASLDVVEPQVGRIDTARATAAETRALERCEATEERAACEAYLDAYPQGVLADRARAVVDALDAQAERRRAMLAAIPPEARRDALMLRIRDALGSDRPQDALPHFAELATLDVALDPDTDFFWGRTLIEAEQPAAGLEKLYRYLASRGRDAARYREALELMNRAERGL